MDELILFQQLRLERAKEELRCCEELNRLHGLVLTESDITELTEFRSQALKNTGRIEFGGGILPKLVRAFCDSPYVDRQNYAATLADLQDAFYYFKNESADRISDDELIEFMAAVFNGQAEGSTDYLTAISLEELCRCVREGWDPYREEEEFD